MHRELILQRQHEVHQFHKFLPELSTWTEKKGQERRKEETSQKPQNKRKNKTEIERNQIESGKEITVEVTQSLIMLWTSVFSVLISGNGTTVLPIQH